MQAGASSSSSLALTHPLQQQQPRHAGATALSSHQPASAWQGAALGAAAMVGCLLQGLAALQETHTATTTSSSRGLMRLRMMTMMMSLRE
jgi:hypothetical protein